MLDKRAGHRVDILYPRIDVIVDHLGPITERRLGRTANRLQLVEKHPERKQDRNPEHQRDKRGIPTCLLHAINLTFLRELIIAIDSTPKPKSKDLTSR